MSHIRECPLVSPVFEDTGKTFVFTESNIPNLGDRRLVCKTCRLRLTIVRSSIRKPHLRHINPEPNLDKQPESIWHSSFKQYFNKYEIEVPLPKKPGMVSSRYADFLIHENRHILEARHTKITVDEVNARTSDYILSGYKVSWVIDITNSIKKEINGVDNKLKDNIHADDACITITKYTFPDHNEYSIEIMNDFWRINSFIDMDVIYFSHSDEIYKIIPKDVKKHMCKIHPPVSKSCFIKSLRDGTDPWIDCPKLIQSYVYYKQQGAGSGKTYGIMQSLNNDPDVTKFNTYIFITKMHSAVHVMYSEFMNQYNEGKLTNIDSDEHKLTYIDNGKKKFVEYYNTQTGQFYNLVFCTVDSFIHKVNSKEFKSYDPFYERVKTILNGEIIINESGTLESMFPSKLIKLNRKTMVLIDETQDLLEEYGDAFLKITNETYMNLFIVGDKLQSLMSSKNIMADFSTKLSKDSVEIKHYPPQNIIRRFKSPKLVNFVNEMVNFKEFGLTKMELHEKSSEDIDDSESLKFFSYKDSNIFIEADDHKRDDISITPERKNECRLDIIMRHYIYEVEVNNRKPEDFLIVSSYVSKNMLLTGLLTAINSYWINRILNDKKFMDKVKTWPYWKDVNYNTYTEYAILHKSDVGTSINLADSEYKTRIVSIHTSKGDGRPVVFALDITESKLQCYNTYKTDLKFESLLHVAITRQKETLYFEVENNYDIIYKRLKPIIAEQDTNLYLSTQFTSKTTALTIKKIVEKSSYDSIESLKDFPKSYIDGKLEKINSRSNTGKKHIIDMGYHSIRYYVMKTNSLIVLYNKIKFRKSGPDNKNQIYALIKNITNIEICDVKNGREYYVILRQNIGNSNKLIKDRDPYKIPLIKYTSKKDTDYYKDYQNIHDILTKTSVSIGSNAYNDPLRILDEDVFSSVAFSYLFNITNNCYYTELPLTHNDIYHYYNLYTSNSSTIFNGDYKKNFMNMVKHNMIPALVEIVDSDDTLNWLTDHVFRLSTDGKINSTLQINTAIDIVAYNKKEVHLFYIKPQFNSLNYYITISRMIMDTALILLSNTITQNVCLTPDHIIKCHILTCDSNKTITFDPWNDLCNKNMDTIKNILHECIEKYYEDYISELFNYIRCNILDIQKKPNSHRGRIDDIIRFITKTKLSLEKSLMKSTHDEPQYYGFIICGLCNIIADIDRPPSIQDKALKIREYFADSKKFIYTFIDLLNSEIKILLKREGMLITETLEEIIEEGESII
jgi:hypothetical protein